MNLSVDTARVLTNGEGRLISVTEVKLGEHIRVKPGELIPADAVIIEGETTLN